MDASNNLEVELRSAPGDYLTIWLVGTTLNQPPPQPDGSVTQTVYNSLGKQSQTIDQLGRSTFYTYDAMGRLIEMKFPDNTTETSEYDAEGRRTKSIDQEGRATQFQYDALGRLVKATFPDNTFSSTTYDAIGQVTETTDARGNVTK